MTPKEAFLTRAAYCYDHRSDDVDSIDESGYQNAAPVLMPVSLKNGAGDYEGYVYEVRVGFTDAETFITLYVPGRGGMRFSLDQIDLPPVPTVDEIRAVAADRSPCFGYTVQFVDSRNIWRDVFVEQGGLNPGYYVHNGVMLYQPQGDLDSDIDPESYMYGDEDARDYMDDSITVPY